MSDDRKVWNVREAAGFHSALKSFTVHSNDKIENGQVLGLCLYIDSLSGHT